MNKVLVNIGILVTESGIELFWAAPSQNGKALTLFNTIYTSL